MTPDLLLSFDYRAIIGLKLALALAGAALLIVRRAGRTHSPLRERFASGLLVLTALGSLLAFTNFGRFQGLGVVNYGDFFHNFVGSKYFVELGYHRLYACLVVADAEDGFAERAGHRWTRNLVTNEAHVGDPALRRPEACKQHFSSDRWAEFKHDVGWFRSRMRLADWDFVFLSHGYNATPFGTAVLFPLGGGQRASDSSIPALASLDIAVWMLMVVAVGWAFGWETAAVVVIWWGTFQPGSWNWIGGSFLRMLPFLCLVGSICLARRQRLGAAGVALAAASLLRIFPIVALSGWALAFVHRLRQGKLRPRFGLAFGLGVLALMPLTLLVPARPAERAVHDWVEFSNDLVRFSRTPFTNAVGLSPLLSFEEATRAVHIGDYWDRYPWDNWRAARSRVLGERRWLHVMAVVAYLALLGYAVRGREQWVALVLGAGAIPFLTALPNYYYSFLLVFAFLGERFPSISILLLGLSAFTNLALALVDARDDLHVLNSLGNVTFVVIATAIVAVDGRRTRIHQEVTQ